MTLSGGKRKINKSLKAWVTFVKRVQKEEKLSYKDAIHRAKQRKDKGEKWMTGGDTSSPMNVEIDGTPMDVEIDAEMDIEETPDPNDMFEPTPRGGRRRRGRRSVRKSRGRARSRRRASRRH